MEAHGRTGDRNTARTERFLVETRQAGTPGVVVLALTGELDHDTAQPLQSALEEQDGTTRIVIDCSDLRFCDSTGLNVLLRTRLRLMESGGRVDLAGLHAPVDRMFEITGARRVFRVYDGLADALADSGQGE
ncbi:MULTISPECIES: STAS domain-containing protein [unclassified Streptomyces]|uniref:STAS domain-containing protein n=1 Tax=unclassified Streptomyces TaxID=2593676 RepID=UPI0033A52456